MKRMTKRTRIMIPKRKRSRNEGGVSSDEEEDNDQYKDGKTSKIPDYSTIESSTSQVKTRSQRLHEKLLNQSRFIEILKLIRKQDLSRISRISMLIQYLKI